MSKSKEDLKIADMVDSAIRDYEIAEMEEILGLEPSSDIMERCRKRASGEEPMSDEMEATVKKLRDSVLKALYDSPEPEILPRGAGGILESNALKLWIAIILQSPSPD